jgi:hypothetical protein
MIDKLPFLSDDHHTAITSLALRVSQLEHHLEFLIWSMMIRQSNAAQVILKTMNADKIVMLAEALLNDAFPLDSDAIKKLFTDIRATRTERNEILHWLWAKTEDDLVAKHASIRPFREERSKTKTAQQISDSAQLALDLIGKLVDFDRRIFQKWDAEKPSPETLFGQLFQSSSPESSFQGLLSGKPRE